MTMNPSTPCAHYHPIVTASALSMLKGRTFTTVQTQTSVMVGSGRHSAPMSLHVYIVASLSRTIVTAGSGTYMRLHSSLKHLRATLPLLDA